MNFYPSVPSQRPEPQLLLTALFVCLPPRAPAAAELSPAPLSVPCWWPWCLWLGCRAEAGNKHRALPLGAALCSWRRAQTPPGWLRVGSRVPASLCRCLAATAEGHFFPSRSLQVGLGSHNPFFSFAPRAAPSQVSPGFVSPLLSQGASPAHEIQDLFRIPGTERVSPALFHASNLQEKSLPAPSAPQFSCPFVWGVPAEPPLTSKR